MKWTHASLLYFCTNVWCEVCTYLWCSLPLRIYGCKYQAESLFLPSSLISKSLKHQTHLTLLHFITNDLCAMCYVLYIYDVAFSIKVSRCYCHEVSSSSLHNLIPWFPVEYCLPKHYHAVISFTIQTVLIPKACIQKNIRKNLIFFQPQLKKVLEHEGHISSKSEIICTQNTTIKSLRQGWWSWVGKQQEWHLKISSIWAITETTLGMYRVCVFVFLHMTSSAHHDAMLPLQHNENCREGRVSTPPFSLKAACCCCLPEVTAQ